jgi:glycerophosphoryl diester phosphodiesterase
VLHPDFLRLPIAHRALHDASAGRPENSRAAVIAAIDAGYGIEIDVQPSAEGRAMVFHDSALDRLTTETGPIYGRPARALARIRLRGSDETIPTLTEILALVAGRVPLLVEIKDQDGALGPAIGALEAAVAADLQGYVGPVAVMSFNPHSVARMAKLSPGLPRGLTTCAFDRADWPEVPVEQLAALAEIPEYDRVGACFVSHQGNDLDRPRIAALRAAGAAILCWTIRSPKDEAVVRRKAHNITFEGYRAAIPAAV